MSRQILLRYPKFKLPFDVCTEACDYQLGGVIIQNENPVTFYSRNLNSAQQNYTTMEKELLPTVEIAVYHRNILLGFKVNFLSTYKYLSFENFKLERVRRWRLIIEEYDYTFTYTPGKDNFIADMISRYPMVDIKSTDIQEMNTLEAENNFPMDLSDIKSHQDNCNIKGNNYIVRKLHGSELKYYKDKIVLPQSLVRPVIEWYHHNLNHTGATHTFKTINEHCYFPNMERIINKFVKECNTCTHTKLPAIKYGHLPPAINAYEPWECVQIDLIGP